MKLHYFLLVSFFVGSLSAGGRTVTDGFESQLVRPSPDREDLGVTECFRLFDVYLPEEFDKNPNQTFPIVYHLTGLGGTNQTYSVPDRVVMDQLIESGQAVPMIIVAPDPGVITYNGSFYTDSPVVGNPDESFNGKFERYIVEELIPFVDQKYRQKKTADGDAAPFRAIMGQSMGGNGSLYFGVKYPELFSAYAGDSPTSFWLINTNLASPDDNPMFTFNKLLLGELPPSNMIDPDNGQNTFDFYSWPAAFSPVNQGIGPEDPLNCTLAPNPCRASFPFCVAYPFNVDDNGIVELINGSLVQNVPISVGVWPQFDPFFILDDIAADPARLEQLKRQALYMDAGADLRAEIVDNVGARFFSDKLAVFDVNNEYLLFDGGHASCTTISQLECYRFTTNLKLFSGKFSEAGIFAPDVRRTIVGDMVIELTDNSVMSIVNKALVGVETDPDNGIDETNVTFKILDNARLEIGNQETIGGGLQVGNAFGKANLLNDPSRADNVINITFELDGPGATLEIGRQGYLGFGVGIDGNQTTLPNFWGLSSLTNVTSVTLNLKQGQLLHNQIASSLNQKGALLALGESSDGYTINIDQDNFVISGGANLASMIQANRIHPTVQTVAGPIDPGGIRNRTVEEPATEFDEFYGPPKGIYKSLTFSLNRMMVGILSSSLMLFDTNKTPLSSDATQEQTFEFLQVADYTEQGRKRASINVLDGQLTIGFVTNDGEKRTISRPVIENGSCNVLTVPFDTDKVLEAGAVGVKLATVNGQQQVIRVYDLDPEV